MAAPLKDKAPHHGITSPVRFKKRYEANCVLFLAENPAADAVGVYEVVAEAGGCHVISHFVGLGIIHRLKLEHDSLARNEDIGVGIVGFSRLEVVEVAVHCSFQSRLDDTLVEVAVDESHLLFFCKFIAFHSSPPFCAAMAPIPRLMESVALVAVTPKLSPKSDTRNTTKSIALAPMSAVWCLLAYAAMWLDTLRSVEAALLDSLVSAIEADVKAIVFIACVSLTIICRKTAAISRRQTNTSEAPQSKDVMDITAELSSARQDIKKAWLFSGKYRCPAEAKTRSVLI